MPPKPAPAKNVSTKNAPTSVKTTSSKTKQATLVKATTSKTKAGMGNVKVSAPKGNKATVKDDKPKTKEWTPQDDAARKIQTKVRQHLAKRALGRKKKEKEDYEAEMERLEKEAFLHLVKLEQEEAERRQKKEDEERKRKQDEIKRRKRMLEAAFDGDVDVMKQILKEVTERDDSDGISSCIIGRSLRAKHLLAIIDCEDANGNTALSEAANGGHASSIKFLLERGADPNTKGQFMRTPLYRAAFAGHLEAVEVLLENGADPRIYASDNQLPVEIASTPTVQEILTSWDVGRTDSLLQQIQDAKEKRAEEDRQRREAETNKLEDIVAEAQKDYESKQKMLDHAYCELNKRITEHDTCVAQGFARPELTLQTIHDQELEVETMKLRVAEARDNLAKARLRLRESVKESEGELNDDLPGLKVTVRELDEVLFRDVGNRIRDSGKWPLLIDQNGQASTFLRYRDTNYVNALRPADMENNNVRRALLGAVRYGKPFVLDFMEVDMFDTCVDRFDGIMNGLMDSIINKSIITEEKYSQLIKKEDGPEYEKNKFNDLRLSNFKFMLVTKNPFLSEQLLDNFYVIRVTVAA